MPKYHSVGGGEQPVIVIIVSGQPSKMVGSLGEPRSLHRVVATVGGAIVEPKERHCVVCWSRVARRIKSKQIIQIIAARDIKAMGGEVVTKRW